MQGVFLPANLKPLPHRGLTSQNYVELEGNHKDHRVQLLALHSTIPTVTHKMLCLPAFILCFLAQYCFCYLCIHKNDKSTIVFSPSIDFYFLLSSY